MINLRCSFVALRALCPTLLLSGLFLLGTGCTTTKTVSSDAPNARSKVTTKAQGKTAHVRLTDGRIFKLTNLYVGPQITSGRAPTGAKRTVPTAALQKVEFANRGMGFLQGAGLGGGSVLTVGLLSSMAEKDDLSQFVGMVGSVVVAVPSALIGGLLGTMQGHRETYRFVTDAPGSRFGTDGATFHRPKPDSSQRRRPSSTQPGQR